MSTEAEIIAESMVERLAREMAEKEGWLWADDKQMLDCGGAGLQYTSRERDTWRYRAKTAISAMRNPTYAMRKVSTFEAAEIEWPKMIDAALQEPRQ